MIEKEKIWKLGRRFLWKAIVNCNQRSAQAPPSQVFIVFVLILTIALYFSYSGEYCVKWSNCSNFVKSANIMKTLKIDAYLVYSVFDRLGSHYLYDLHKQLRREILYRLVVVLFPTLGSDLLAYSDTFVIFINY